MKTLTFARCLLLSLLFMVCAMPNVMADTLRLSEPVSTTNTTETFGTKLNTSLTKVSLATLMSEPQNNLSNDFLLETRIAKVCQKKGCFFIAQQDEHVIRVSFLDYGFFLPTDSSGKTVMLTGKLVQKEMSKEQAEHFASDLNNDAKNSTSKALQAGVVYEIIANSVQVPLS